MRNKQWSNYTRFLGIFGFILALLFVSGTPVSASPGASTTPPLQWSPCEGAPTTPARECTTVDVPLDYANPNKGTAPLQVARIKANDPNPAHHKGTLLMLPGGPPSTGVDYVGYTANIDRWFTPQVQAAYDIIGIEQLGSWDGVPCISGDALKTYWESNHLPRNAADVDRITAMEKSFNKGCADPANKLVPYMNSARSVRDIDTVRQALGTDKLQLLSFSYGTGLAHSYMSQYTSHVGRAVLDSVDDHTVPDPIRDKENNSAFEKSWSLFKDWCQSSADCVLRGQDLDNVYDTALAKAKNPGIPAPRNPFGNRTLNDWEFTVSIEALTGAGEATRIWGAVTLRDAANGDGSQAEYLYDLLTGRRPDGTYLGGDGTSRTIGCNSNTWSQIFKKPSDVQSWATVTQLFAPRYGAASVYQGVAQCYGWQFPPVNPAPRIEPVISSNKALLINADNDASTPLPWAKRVQAQIAGSKLVIVNGSTHLQSIHSRCAAAYATNYLINGILPADGSRCNYDADLNPPQLPPGLGPLQATANTSGKSVPPDVLSHLKEAAPLQ